jgi:hypothetical protein
MDEEADAGDDENHHARQRIEQIAPIGEERDGTADGGNLARGDPFEQNLLKDALAWIEAEKSQSGARGVKKGKKHAAYTEEVDRLFRKEAANEEHERGGNQRKERDEPKMLEEIVGGGHDM